MIKTVIFDIDNTLYSYDDAHAIAFQAICEYARQHLSISKEEFTALHKETNQALIASMGPVAATHNRLIRYQNILERKNLPLVHALPLYETYWDTLIKASVASPGSVEALKALHDSGCRIGIGTDMTARIQHVKLRELGHLPYIDFIVSSEEAGAEKPTARFFSTCLAKADCLPEECAFIGDHLKKDVLGSEAAGMHGIWYRPQGVDPSESVMQMTHFSQLPDMILSL